MVIFCSFVRSEGLCEDIIVSVFIHWGSWGNSLKEEVFQIEMHLRLTFPLEMYAGLVYFICALSLGIYSLRPHHLPFRGFPFHLSTHQSGRSQWGWFSCALSCQLETERCSGPQRYRNLQSILGREPKRWSLLQGKKKNKPTKPNDSEIAALPAFAGLMNTAALTLSLGRTVLFLVQLKISNADFSWQELINVLGKCKQCHCRAGDPFGEIDEGKEIAKRCFDPLCHFPGDSEQNEHVCLVIQVPCFKSRRRWKPLEEKGIEKAEGIFSIKRMTWQNQILSPIKIFLLFCQEKSLFWK